MNEFGVKIMQTMNMSPIFKGTAVTIIGFMALLFAWWMREKWHEPLKSGFIAFIALSVFIILYGLYVLVIQPNWWALPY